MDRRACQSYQFGRAGPGSISFDKLSSRSVLQVPDPQMLDHGFLEGLRRDVVTRARAATCVPARVANVVAVAALTVSGSACGHRAAAAPTLQQTLQQLSILVPRLGN